jgi:fluoroacetyl-CoA thioesterase
MRPIPPGARGTFTLTVGPQHLASQLKDTLLPPVLATPVLVLAMENAALDAIRSFLEPGESAVGTAIDVRHLAPTPVGHLVQAQAEVAAVDGRRIRFEVSASDETEVIGRGTHERMVVDVRRVAQRLAAKQRPAEQAP